MSDTFMTVTERTIFFAGLLALHVEYGDRMDQRERLTFLTRQAENTRTLYYRIIDRNNRNDAKMTRILEKLDREASRTARDLVSSNRYDYATPGSMRHGSDYGAPNHPPQYTDDRFGTRMPIDPVAPVTSGEMFAAGVLLTGIAAIVSAARSSK